MKYGNLQQGVRNEPLDLRVYNLACMNSIHPDWDRLAEVVKGGGHSTTTVTTPRKENKCGNVCAELVRQQIFRRMYGN